jgi:predicted N-formylglutamate amidohydrolase
VEAALDSVVRSRRVAVHIASHSFAPVLAGKKRTADVAFLYDPKRRAELRFVRTWQQELRRIRPDLKVRRNYPYRGDSDGLTTFLRTRFGSRLYLGIELEVNQSWYAGGKSGFRSLGRAIRDSLSETLRAMT